MCMTYIVTYLLVLDQCYMYFFTFVQMNSNIIIFYQIRSKYVKDDKDLHQGTQLRLKTNQPFSVEASFLGGCPLGCIG